MNIGIKKIIFILSGVIIFIVIIILVIAGVAAQRGADLSLEYNLHEPDVPVVQQQQKSTESVTDTFV
ncbi:MAG: hypothetical protein HN424_05080, partial [Candidatus Jacksonbacteria bacterium]|nr:hypothetical protein [Candidatus Jacksonbacteria bacterium]